METKEEMIADIKAKIIEGLHKTYEKLLETKRRNNGVLAISENGKIIRIKPNKK